MVTRQNSTCLPTTSNSPFCLMQGLGVADRPNHFHSISLGDLGGRNANWFFCNGTDLGIPNVSFGRSCDNHAFQDAPFNSNLRGAILSFFSHNSATWPPATCQTHRPVCSALPDPGTDTTPFGLKRTSTCSEISDILGGTEWNEVNAAFGDRTEYQEERSRYEGCTSWQPAANLVNSYTALVQISKRMRLNNFIGASDSPLPG
jgi:hypothetical protein